MRLRVAAITLVVLNSEFIRSMHFENKSHFDILPKKRHIEV